MTQTTPRTPSDRRTAYGLFATFLLLTVVGAAYVMRHKGIWFDEAWPVYMGAHDLPFARALTERWMHDDYPPLFYATSWLFEPLLGDDVGQLRRLNLIVLAVTAVALASVVRRRRELAMPVLLAAVLTLGNPIGFDFLVLIRAYFAQCCAWLVCLLCLFAVVTGERDYRAADDRGLAAALAVAVLLALNLHYLLAFQSALALACFIVVLWMTGKRGWATRLFAMTAVGSIVLLLTAAAQWHLLTHMTAHYWASTTTRQALAIMAVALLLIFVANPVALVGAALAARGNADRTGGDTRRRLYAATCLAALVLCLVAMLAFNAARPVIIRQYLAPLFPLGEMAVVALVLPAIGSRRWLLPAMVANALLWTGAYSWKRSHVKDWDEMAAELGERTRACPSTRVIAVPALVMAGAPSLTGLDDIVTGSAYRHLGVKYGFHPIVRITPATTSADPRCPTIVWVEQYAPALSPVEAARSAGLAVAPAAVSRAVVRRTGTGQAIIYPPVG